MFSEVLPFALCEISAAMRGYRHHISVNYTINQLKFGETVNSWNQASDHRGRGAIHHGDNKGQGWGAPHLESRRAFAAHSSPAVCTWHLPRGGCLSQQAAYTRLAESVCRVAKTNTIAVSCSCRAWPFAFCLKVNVFVTFTPEQ